MPASDEILRTFSRGEEGVLEVLVAPRSVCASSDPLSYPFVVATRRLRLGVWVCARSGVRRGVAGDVLNAVPLWLVLRTKDIL